MKKSEIHEGRTYKGRRHIRTGRIPRRRVTDIGDYPEYPAQMDHDCVRYVEVGAGTTFRCTRKAFARWAVEEWKT